eukprot:m.172018 g.172018  ORF g.172018 m.172018 type:complete len:399 (-) comp10395_c0_seq15:1864-3060(-)
MLGVAFQKRKNLQHKALEFAMGAGLQLNVLFNTGRPITQACTEKLAVLLDAAEMGSQRLQQLNLALQSCRVGKIISQFLECQLLQLTLCLVKRRGSSGDASHCLQHCNPRSITLACCWHLVARAALLGDVRNMSRPLFSQFKVGSSPHRTAALRWPLAVHATSRLSSAEGASPGGSRSSGGMSAAMAAVSQFLTRQTQRPCAVVGHDAAARVVHSRPPPPQHCSSSTVGSSRQSRPRLEHRCSGSTAAGGQCGSWCCLLPARGGSAGAACGRCGSSGRLLRPPRHCQAPHPQEPPPAHVAPLPQPRAPPPDSRCCWSCSCSTSSLPRPCWCSVVALPHCGKRSGPPQPARHLWPLLCLDAGSCAPHHAHLQEPGYYPLSCSPAAALLSLQALCPPERG